ncbi:pickpocket protein 28-like [Culicoides brevitarsis]|uniref:pickpocket protein 28-like n=1 Tax=Culicoides brevitarsis TaxID=469753 RepID=UPI00307C2C19
MPNRNKFNYTDFLKRFLAEDEVNYTEEEIMLFDVVTKVCFQRIIKSMQKLFERADDIPIYNSSDLLEIMDEYFLPSTLKLFFCSGVLPEAINWDCNFRFTRIWLKEGLCYSFNLLPRSEIFREGVEFPLADKPNFVIPEDEPRKTHATEYVDDIGEQKEIYRVKSRRDRLHVRTRAYEDFTDPTCDPDFLVFIHNPYEIPWDRQTNGHLIEVDEFVKNVLTVEPYVVRTDENLKNTFTPEERDCYFEDERPLKFFKRYSQRNCELECVTNISLLLETYNCVAHWMPRTPEMPLCHFSKYMQGYFNGTEPTDDLENCGCLPDCNGVEYSVTIQTSHTPFFYDTAITRDDAMQYQSDFFAEQWMTIYLVKLFMGLNRDYDFEIPLTDALKVWNHTLEFDAWKWKFSEIEVHYESSEFLAMRRHLAYSFADFVSQIGGIFGCFLGCSIFSIIEIVYFCTVKMMKGVKAQNKRKRRRQTRNSIINIKPKLNLNLQKY